MSTGSLFVGGCVVFSKPAKIYTAGGRKDVMVCFIASRCVRAVLVTDHPFVYNIESFDSDCRDALFSAIEQGDSSGTIGVIAESHEFFQTCTLTNINTNTSVSSEINLRGDEKLVSAAKRFKILREAIDNIRELASPPTSE